MEEYTGPLIKEQSPISQEHEKMISDLQSIVKDLKDLYRNAEPGKKNEKDDDITTIPIKKYDKKQSGNADITLGIENYNTNTNDSIKNLLGSIKDNIKSNGANSHTKRQEFSDLKNKIKSLTITRDNGDKDILEFGTPPYNREIQNITVCQVEDNKSKKVDKYIVFEYTSNDYDTINEGVSQETIIKNFKQSTKMDKFANYKTRTYKLVIDLTNDVVYNYCQDVTNVIASDLEHSNLQKPMDTSNLHNHFRNPFFIVQPKITEKEIDEIIKNKQKNENTLPDCNQIDNCVYGKNFEYAECKDDEILLQLENQSKQIKEELCKNEYLDQHLNKILKNVLNQEQKEKEKLNIKGCALCYENLISTLQQVDRILDAAQELINECKADKSSTYVNICYECALNYIDSIIQANTSWTIMKPGEFGKFKDAEGLDIIAKIQQSINAILDRKESSHQQPPSLQVDNKPKKIQQSINDILDRKESSHQQPPSLQVDNKPKNSLPWWKHVLGVVGLGIPYLFFCKTCCNEPEVLEDLSSARGRGKGRSVRNT